MIIGYVQDVTLTKVWYNQFLMWLFTRLFNILYRYDKLSIVFSRAAINVFLYTGGKAAPIPARLVHAFAKEEIASRFSSVTAFVGALPYSITHKGRCRSLVPGRFIRWLYVRHLDRVYIKWAQENPEIYAKRASDHFKHRNWLLGK